MPRLLWMIIGIMLPTQRRLATKRVSRLCSAQSEPCLARSADRELVHGRVGIELGQVEERHPFLQLCQTSGVDLAISDVFGAGKDVFGAIVRFAKS